MRIEREGTGGSPGAAAFPSRLTLDFVTQSIANALILGLDHYRLEITTLQEGQRVAFTPSDSPKGPRAENVYAPDTAA